MVTRKVLNWKKKPKTKLPQQLNTQLRAAPTIPLLVNREPQTSTEAVQSGGEVRSIKMTPSSVGVSGGVWRPKPKPSTKPIPMSGEGLGHISAIVELILTVIAADGCNSLLCTVFDLMRRQSP